MPSLTNRELKFATLVFLSVVMTLGAIVYFVRSHSGSQGGKLAEATTSFLYGLLAALVIALIALAFKPLQTWLQAYLAIPDGTKKEIRILLFGQTGCGKTSFSEFALTVNPLEVMDSTHDFVPRYGTATLDSKDSTKILNLVLGDYRGEEPSQVTVQIPDSFAGVQGNRLIDAIIFFVDLIGRELDPETKQVLSDEKVLQWLQQGPDGYVTRRINQHKSYLSAAVLEILFSTVYSKRLKNVFLALTKADLMRSAAAGSVLPGFAVETLEASVESCFEDVLERINAACLKNNIPACTLSVISLRDESARRFWFDMLRRIDSSRNGGTT